MCVDSDRDPKGTGQSKVRKFDDSVVVDQKVLWFQISVQNAATVTKADSLQNLIKITL